MHNEPKTLTDGKIVDLMARMPTEKIGEHVRNCLNNGWTLTPEGERQLARERIEIPETEPSS